MSWRNWFGNGNATRRRTLRSRADRLALESLETRRLMARDIDFDDPIEPPITFSKIECFSSRDCFIDGSTGNDRAEIQREGNNVVLSLTYLGNNGTMLTTKKTVPFVRSVTFSGGEGDDTFLNGTDIPSDVTGGAGNDNLRGGSGKDSLFGLEGNDLLDGSGGDDVLMGGAGNDSLRGNAGIDFLYGENGRDTIRGGTGDDFLHGQADIDTLFGDDGIDYLDGGFDLSLDSLTGGTGADIFINHSRFTGGSRPVVAANVVANAQVNPPVNNIGNAIGIRANFNVANLGLQFQLLGEPVDTSTDLDAAGGDLSQQHLHESEAADPRAPMAVFVRGGDLNVEGAIAGDTAIVTSVSLWDSTGGIAVRPRSFFRVNVNGSSLLFAQSTVNGGDVFFNGRAGNDTFTNSTTLRSTANGGDGDDTLRATRGLNSLRGEAGNDTLTGGTSIDFLDGGAGTDLVIASGGGFTLSNSSLIGTVTGSDSISGIERANLFGAGSDDRIDASAFTIGSVVIDGGGGSDTLIGTPNGDRISGGSGNDNLYGRSGKDTLLGGSGTDGLYGGQDLDSLSGGTGSDRFLDRSWVEKKLLIFSERKWEDTITDYNDSQDTRIAFENGGETTRDFAGQTGKYTYAAGTWADDEVEVIDSALGILHRATGNVRLLEKKNGDLLRFVRQGALINSEGGSFTAGAWNSDGVVFFPETISAGDRGTTLHEIGHNWDTEYNASAWRAVSGWTTSDKSKDANFEKALDQDTNWWYLKSAQFASNYAKTNPNEDFAESFEAYFLSVGGFSSNVSSIPDKKAFLDNMVADLS
jgi:Ca2+-binding RTX toxin-like protein